MEQDIFFRFGTLVIFLLWRMYWRITEIQSDKEIEKTKHTTEKVDTFQRVFIIACFLLVSAQLLGFSFLPFPRPVPYLSVIGFVVVIIGFCISVAARVSLGANWANSYEFQIKKGQKLVTSGIYQYIRHPIYTGVVAMLLGAGLITQSYVVFFYPLLLIGKYWQAKREEKLLLSHYKEEYKAYMKRSKMFLPFLW